MAKVTLSNPMIQSLSGRVGDHVFRTDKRTGVITMCSLPKRTKKPRATDTQQSARTRFAVTNQAVNRCLKDPMLRAYMEAAHANPVVRGKYHTLRSYVFHLLYPYSEGPSVCAQ